MRPCHHGTAVSRRCAPPRRLLMPTIAPVLLPSPPLRPTTALHRSHGETTRPLPRTPSRRAAVTHSAPVLLLPPCRRTRPLRSSLLPPSTASTIVPRNPPPPTLPLNDPVGGDATGPCGVGRDVAWQGRRRGAGAGQLGGGRGEDSTGRGRGRRRGARRGRGRRRANTRGGNGVAGPRSSTTPKTQRGRPTNNSTNKLKEKSLSLHQYIVFILTGNVKYL